MNIHTYLLRVPGRFLQNTPRSISLLKRIRPFKRGESRPPACNNPFVLSFPWLSLSIAALVISPTSKARYIPSIVLPSMPSSSSSTANRMAERSMNQLRMRNLACRSSLLFSLIKFSRLKHEKSAKSQRFDSCYRERCYSPVWPDRLTNSVIPHANPKKPRISEAHLEMRLHYLPSRSRFVRLFLPFFPIVYHYISTIFIQSIL